jgi:hypothetical protein
VIAALVLAFGMLGVALAGVEQRTLATEVNVTLTNGKLTVRPARVPVGSVTFSLVNKGRQLAVFAVTGPGVKGVQTRNVKPRHIATLNMKLRTGNYMLWDQAPTGSSTARRLVVQSPTDAAGEYKRPPQQPPTHEIAPTGVGCDV